MEETEPLIQYEKKHKEDEKLCEFSSICATTFTLFTVLNIVYQIFFNDILNNLDHAFTLKLMFLFWSVVLILMSMVTFAIIAILISKQCTKGTFRVSKVFLQPYLFVIFLLMYGGLMIMIFVYGTSTNRNADCWMTSLIWITSIFSQAFTFVLLRFYKY